MREERVFHLGDPDHHEILLAPARAMRQRLPFSPSPRDRREQYAESTAQAPVVWEGDWLPMILFLIHLLELFGIHFSGTAPSAKAAFLLAHPEWSYQGCRTISYAGSITYMAVQYYNPAKRSTPLPYLVYCIDSSEGSVRELSAEEARFHRLRSYK